MDSNEKGKSPWISDSFSTVKAEAFPTILTARVWGAQTYDELNALGGMLIGSPEQVAKQVDHLQTIGIDTLLLVASFGNLAHEQVCSSLELLAKAVM